MNSILEITVYGTKLWKDEFGRYHRDDGPAIEFSTGGERWFKHGTRHRSDGPAFISAGGNLWYIEDVDITEEVEAWMEECGVPPWEDWLDEHRILFKLRF